MTELSDDEAASLVQVILELLASLQAHDVIAGIEESRLLGVVEPSSPDLFPKAYMREVGTVRRRPLRGTELLQLVFERVHQRLIVLPEISRALKARMGSVDWRVDTEFVSSERTSLLQAHNDELSPDGWQQVLEAYDTLRAMLKDIVPERTVNG